VKQGGLVNSTAVYYVHNDHLGTPQVMTDENGNVAWRAIYDPFGDASIDVASTETLNVRFPGQYYDQETGLHYNMNRYYDPEAGRYLTSDPIGLRASLNTYAYVDNQPINWFDLYGLAKSCSYWGGTNCREYDIPDNGNFWPGYDEQDMVCTNLGGVIQTMLGYAYHDSNRDCITQCCADHDNCYDLYGCNMSSFIPYFGADGPCKRCNKEAAKCFIDSWDKNDCKQGCP
jgi:RHS repeat-associated protein